MRGNVALLIVLLLLFVGLSSIWNPGASTVNTAHVETEIIVKQVAPRRDRLILVFGWRPALIMRQLRELVTKAKEAPTMVVLLCPDDEDVMRAARLIQDSNVGSSMDVYRHPVEDRTTLLTGRYVLEAAHAYLSHRAAASKQTTVFAISDEISKVVVIDPTRAAVCGDVLEHTGFDLTVADFAINGKRSFQMEYEKAVAFRTLSVSPLLDGDRQRSSAGDVAPKGYAPQVFGGSTRVVLQFLNHTLLRFGDDGIRSGSAIEPTFSEAVSSFTRQIVASSSAITKTATAANNRRPIRTYGAQVDHRRLLSRCDGEGIEGHMDTCKNIPAGSMKVVTNFLLCDPSPPSAHTIRESGTLEPQVHCRSIFTKQIVVRHHPQQRQSSQYHHPLMQYMSPPLESVNITSMWGGFRYEPPNATTAQPRINANSLVDLVVGVAMGYKSSKLHKFLTSFEKHHKKGSTMLALIVRAGDLASFEGFLRNTGAVDVKLFVDQEMLSVGSRGAAPQLSRCPVVLSRMEVLRNFLRAAQNGMLQKFHSLRIRRVMIIDTRDAMFQLDPFEVLTTSALYGNLEGDQRNEGGQVPDDAPMPGTLTNTSSEANYGSNNNNQLPPPPKPTQLDGSEDFILFPTERFSLSLHEFLFFGPYTLNRFWVGGAFGMQFFNELVSEPITGDRESSDGVTFPILCGGLYLGSIAAIVDFFEVFVASAVALGGCTINDQGLLIGMVAVGLTESRFPHPVLLSDPYTTPFTNGPRGGGEIVWDSQGRVVNCHGAPYAVVHQFDRYKMVWSALR